MMSWILGLHLFSAHVPNCWGEPCQRYEVFTPGIYAKAPSGLTVGAYRSSYGDGSTYVGWTFETKDRRFALLVGGVTGYSRASVLPLIVPSVKVGNVRLAFMPRFEKGGASVAHVAVEF